MLLLPGVPQLDPGLATGPTLLGHPITGHVPVAIRYPFEGNVPPQYEASARGAVFDNDLYRCVPKVTQTKVPANR